MPNIKDLLKAPLTVPKSIEASLPTGAPQVSTLLGSLVDGLPEMPALPAGMALPTGMPRITEFIKSIETGLPAGLPKIGQAVGGESPPPAPRKAPELVFE